MAMVGQPLGAVQAEVIAAEFLSVQLWSTLQVDGSDEGEWYRIEWSRRREENRRREEGRKRKRRKQEDIQKRHVLYGIVWSIVWYGKYGTVQYCSSPPFLVLFSLFSCPLHPLRPYRPSWPLIILTRPPSSVAYAVIRLPAVPPRRISPHVGSGPSVASAAALI
jgi:hypothetical protein